MNRRRFLTLGAAGLGTAGLGAAGLGMLGSLQAPKGPARSFSSFSVQLGAMKVTALRTGAVAVKRAQLTHSGPALLGIPALLLDPRWTRWLPITAWLVEYPEGVLVVDTGETARSAEPGYFRCDAATAFAYEHLLRFDVPAAMEIGPQLRALGIPPEDVRRVALTHLHSDHAGGLRSFPNAEILLSRKEIERPPQGALPCRWPEGFQPIGVDFDDGPFGAFEQSRSLSSDGKIRLIPTPGHTHGHQSVLLEHEGRFVLLAGDASYSLEQVRRKNVGGICEDGAASRRTLAILAEQIEQFPTIYLASHDPDMRQGA